MKKIFLIALLALGLSGCVIYHPTEPVSSALYDDGMIIIND